MFKCEYCNTAEFETEKQLKGHQIACRKKYQTKDTLTLPTISPDQFEALMEELEESRLLLAQLKDAPVSIPLSACPLELAYLQENRQMFLQVAGRKIGDRFVVEGTKVVR